MEEPYFLICPTYQMAGGVPHQVRRWLETNNNWHQMHSVIGTGNRNFAGDFGKAGWTIAQDYGVAQAMNTIEISGTKSDVLRIKELVASVEYALS
jgi:protein involved in ribonucleotide reduction